MEVRGTRPIPDHRRNIGCALAAQKKGSAVPGVDSSEYEILRMKRDCQRCVLQCRSPVGAMLSVEYDGSSNSGNISCCHWFASPPFSAAGFAYAFRIGVR